MAEEKDGQPAGYGGRGGPLFAFFECEKEWIFSSVGECCVECHPSSCQQG